MFDSLIAVGLDAEFGPEWHKEHMSTGGAIDKAITPTITAMQAQITALESAVSALSAVIPVMHLNIQTLMDQVAALQAKVATLSKEPTGNDTHTGTPPHVDGVSTGPISPPTSGSSGPPIIPHLDGFGPAHTDAGSPPHSDTGFLTTGSLFVVPPHFDAGAPPHADDPNAFNGSLPILP